MDSKKLMKFDPSMPRVIAVRHTGQSALIFDAALVAASYFSFAPFPPAVSSHPFSSSKIFGGVANWESAALTWHLATAPMSLPSDFQTVSAHFCPFLAASLPSVLTVPASSPVPSMGVDPSQ